MVVSSIGKIKTVMDDKGKVITQATDTSWKFDDSWKYTGAISQPQEMQNVNQDFNPPKDVSRATDTYWTQWNISSIGQQTQNKNVYTDVQQQTPTQPIKSSIWKPQEDYILWVNELSPEMKSIYDQLWPYEQKKFEAIGEQARKTGQDYAKAQADYMRQYQQEVKFREEQKARTDEISGIQEWVAQRESTQRLENAKQQLGNLKQNLAYIGTMGKPWVSSQYLDAVQDQITRAQTSFGRLQMTEEDMQTARRLGMEYNEAWYERQMALLEDELGRNVSQAVQDAINNFNADASQIDTLDEFEQLRVKILEQLDTKVAEYGAGTVDQMNFLINESWKLQDQMLQKIEAERKAQQEYQTNANTINMDMSTAQGYYVDNNGNPVISATTWMPIQVPQESDIKPIFDKDSGQLISFSVWPNGEYIPTVQQVIDQPTFEQETFANLATAVQNWFMTPAQAIALVPKNGQQAFISQMAQLRPQQAPMTAMEQAKYDYQLLKNEELKTEIAQSQLEWVTDPLERATIIAAQRGKLDVGTGTISIPKWTRWNQCGEFVNDSLWTRVFGDSIAQKKSKINSVEPEIWAAVVMDRWNQYWHVGLVKDINMEEWTITVLHSNYNSSGEVTEDKFDIYDPQIAGYYVWDSGQIDYQDVIDFNDKVSRREMSDADKNRIAAEKQKVMSDPDADIQDIMSWSQWWKEIGQSQSQQIDKFSMAIDQLGELSSAINDMSTWPIIGKLRQMNPYDTDRKVLESTLAGLVPTVARGIYWEVWVLTDNDIAHYVKTLPNLKNTWKQNEAIMALNLRVFAWWYKRKLASLAWQWYDVSWLEGIYLDLMNEVETLEQSAWVVWSEAPDQDNPLWLDL